uniref:Uncharacterized protein n=1 Tax=Anguilla anguilla TaxID=7936 RepID=A0A0E9W4Z4_ANGAN
MTMKTVAFGYHLTLEPHQKGLEAPLIAMPCNLMHSI